MNSTTRSEALDELRTQLSATGLKALLEHIRTLALVMDGQGEMIGWNPAFDGVRAGSEESTRFADLVNISAAELEHYSQAVLQGTDPLRLDLDIGGKPARLPYDCLLIRVSENRLLLIAEPFISDLDKLRGDLREAKQALDVKQQELQAVLAQADEVAHTDALTYLPNRRAILAELQRQVTYSERYGTPLTVSMVDLDNFKDVNDTYGHQAGDQVLRFMASELRDRIRGPDLIGRYGGDEFLMILPNTTASAAAEQAARLCKQVWSTTLTPTRPPIEVNLSIGIAQYQAHGDTWRALLERADQALYQAKSAGRRQWAILKT
jgi:diguanylate cyclase (GGDEF)-like protein